MSTCDLRCFIILARTACFRGRVVAAAKKDRGQQFLVRKGVSVFYQLLFRDTRPSPALKTSGHKTLPLWL